MPKSPHLNLPPKWGKRFKAQLFSAGRRMYAYRAGEGGFETRPYGLAGAAFAQEWHNRQFGVFQTDNTIGS